MEKKICKVDGCKNKHEAKGYCVKHYKKFKKYGNPLYRKPEKICKIDNCNREAISKGYCSLHDQRRRRHGDPLRGRTEKLCSIDGCNNKHRALGYCTKHYTMYLRYGDPHHCKVDWHGLSKIPEYHIWGGMKARCYNPKTDRYSRYGGRGIIVCDRWKNSFTAFYKDMGPRPSKNHQIDRIDPNGNYEPSNCRWVLPTINSRNRTTGVLNDNIVKEIRTLNSKGISIQEITRKLDINYHTIWNVLHHRAWK